jgi:hypothetical protein
MTGPIARAREVEDQRPYRNVQRLRGGHVSKADRRKITGSVAQEVELEEVHGKNQVGQAGGESENEIERREREAKERQQVTSPHTLLMGRI